MSEKESPPPDPAQAVLRSFSPSEIGQRRLRGRHMTVPFALCGASEAANVCPPAILSEDPSGSGLGVWVLLPDKSSEHECVYEYAGGLV